MLLKTKVKGTKFYGKLFQRTRQKHHQPTSLIARSTARMLRGIFRGNRTSNDHPYEAELRLRFAYFFDYLLKNVRAFRDYKDVYDFTAEDLNKITLGNLEAYMEYLSYYSFDGKEKTNAEKGKARKISTVRTFFKYMYNHDRINQNVSSKLTMPKNHDKDIIRLEKRKSSAFSTRRKRAPE